MEEEEMTFECEKCRAAAILNCSNCGHETLLPISAWKVGSQTTILKFLPPPPRWTREKPTEPGWYWYDNEGDTSPEITLIFEREGKLGFHVDDDEGFWPLEDCSDYLWAGPLIPPEEEK